MAESKLRQLLHDLDVELQKTPGLDEKQRQHIATIRQEVEAVLGPFSGSTSKYQRVFRVRIRDPWGQERTGWVRLGNWWLGLLSDQAEERWE